MYTLQYGNLSAMGAKITNFMWVAEPPSSHRFDLGAGERTETRERKLWLELRRLPPIKGFVGSGPVLVTLLA